MTQKERLSSYYYARYHAKMRGNYDRRYEVKMKLLRTDQFCQFYKWLKKLLQYLHTKFTGICHNTCKHSVVKLLAEESVREVFKTVNHELSNNLIMP